MKKNKKNIPSLNIAGKNIKRIRKEKKITQEALCARMQIMGFKLSRTDISKLENGKRSISDLEIIGFSNALKIELIDLFK